MPQDGGSLEQRVFRGDASVGPDFENELVVIGALADAGVFHAYFTRVTGEKMESIGITPIGWSACLFSSPVANPRPTLTSSSASNFCLLSSVQMIWSLFRTSIPWIAGCRRR